MNVRTILVGLGALLLLLAGAPSLASAQSPDPAAPAPDQIARLDILVWPEFDDPRVLVQYDGEFAAKDNYPRDVSFYIPSNASVTATAYGDESDQLLNTDPASTQQLGDGLARLSFNLPKPRFHVEFYVDAIKGSPDKALDFVYKAVQPAEQVRLEIQQPLKADKFTTDPVAALQSEGMHDFKYHIFNYPSIAADQTLEVKVSYVKTDPNPSLQNVVPPETAPGTTTAAAADAAPANPQQIYIIAGIGLALALGLLALWMWFARRQPGLRFAFAGGGASTRKGERTAGGYCGQCGNALRAGDNFCPKCGTRRKG